MKKLTFVNGLAAIALAALILPGLVFALPDKELKCPISGKPAKEATAINVNGKTVAFCCNNCPKAYAKKYKIKAKVNDECPMSGKKVDEDTTIVHLTAKKVAFCCNNCPKKYAEQNEIAFKDKGADEAKCPLSGKDAKADQKLVVNGESVYFCCGNCKKAYTKKALGIAKVKDETAACPLSGKDTKDDTSMIVVTGKKVAFCCNNCQKKYIATKIKAEK